MRVTGPLLYQTQTILGQIGAKSGIKLPHISASPSLLQTLNWIMQSICCWELKSNTFMTTFQDMNFRITSILLFIALLSCSCSYKASKDLEVNLPEGDFFVMKACAISKEQIVIICASKDTSAHHLLFFSSEDNGMEWTRTGSLNFNSFPFIKEFACLDGTLYMSVENYSSFPETSSTEHMVSSDTARTWKRISLYDRKQITNEPENHTLNLDECRKHIVKHELSTGAVDTLVTIRDPEWIGNYINSGNSFAFMSHFSKKVKVYVLNGDSYFECAGISNLQHFGSQIPLKLSYQDNGFIYLSLQNLHNPITKTTLVSTDEGFSWRSLFNEEYETIRNDVIYYFEGYGKERRLFKKIVNS